MKRNNTPTLLWSDWLKKLGLDRDFKFGIAQKRYQARYIRRLSSPAPRRDLFPRLGYLPIPTITANRGCNNHCAYCVDESIRLPPLCRPPHS